MFASSPDLSPDYMVAVTSAGVPMQFGADLEKENDHLPPSRKSGKKQQSANPAGTDSKLYQQKRGIVPELSMTTFGHCD